MNWGGFAGGFSQGFNNGVSFGKTVNDLIKQDKLEKIRAQGIAEAKAQQEAAINNAVRENGIDTATPATAPTAPTAQGDQPAPSAAPDQAKPQMAEDPMTADQPPPVDASLAGAPKAPVAEPAATAAVTRAAAPEGAPAPAPAEPSPAPKDAPIAAAGISTPTPQPKFTVNGKGFQTREEALKYARDSAPDVMDFMHKTLVPKMQQAYIEQGDIEKAEAWGKWAKDKQNERHMESWANAFKAYQAGDFVSAAQNLVKMHADLPDGNTIVGADPVKDKDGNVTGFNMKLKNDATGETRAQFVDPKTLTEAGLGALSPDKMFSTVFERQKQADLLTAKARIDAENDNRTFKREIVKQQYIEDRADKRDEARDRRAAAKDERAHGYKLEEMVTADQLKTMGAGREERAKVQGKIDILKENGYTPDAIRELIPHMVGGDGYKKTTSPEEARRLLMTERIKDPIFSRKPPAEQKAIIDQDMQTVYGTSASPAGQGAGTGKPAPSSELTIGAPAPAGLADGAYKDSKTGQPFRVQGGKIVPLK